MRKVFCLITITVLYVSGIFAQIPQSPHFALQRLADGVYAAIASDTGFAVCNAGIVDLGEEVLVFDPFISPRAAADLRAAAIALTGKKIRYVVDSHYHNDHIRGNQEFPGASIVSTIRTRQAIAENEPEEISWEKAHIAERLLAAEDALSAEADDSRRAEDRFWVKYYEAILDSHDSLRTVLPDLTFERKFVLHGTTRSVELIEEGGGHSASDLVLSLPSDGIVFTGDLLFIRRHPYLPDGSPAGWLHALQQIMTLHARMVVPGHGPVGDSSHVVAMGEYIEAVRSLGSELAKSGATEEQIRSVKIPAPYQDWWFGRFFVPNVKFLAGQAN